MTKFDIPSPCTTNCGISNETNLCIGCFRSREEIIEWRRLNNNQKIKIVKELHERRAQITGTPNLRSARRNRRR